jgi:hypothetical protein
MRSGELPYDLPRGIGGALAEPVVQGGLVALTSEHDAPPVLDVVAAEEHEQVLDVAMASGAVLPARLGTEVESVERVRSLLRARYSEFLGDLRRLAGKVEIVVHAERGAPPAGLRSLACDCLIRDGAPAYLVEKPRLDAFVAAVAQADAASGTRLLVTGPWPPYSFVTDAAQVAR